MTKNLDYNKYGYIYRTINTVNKKTYIGLHKMKKNEDWLAYLGSGRLLKNAVEKYGKENFSKELLEYSNSLQELKELEKNYIKKEVENGGAQYNLYYSQLGVKKYFLKNEVTDELLLFLTFEEKLTPSEIAKLIPTATKNKVALRLNQIAGYKLTALNLRWIDSLNEAVKIRKTCSNCNKEFTASRMTQHYNSCSKKNYCSYLNCDKLLNKAGSKYCLEHKFNEEVLERVNKNLSSEDRSLGGVKTAHIRFHSNKFSENCSFCQAS